MNSRFSFKGKGSNLLATLFFVAILLVVGALFQQRMSELLIHYTENQTKRQAETLAIQAAEKLGAELENLGFRMLVLSERVMSREPYGTVIEQNPAPNEMLTADGIVQVTLSGGMMRLAELKGMTREDALRQLETQEITVKEIKEIKTEDTTLNNIVAAQQYLDAQDRLIEVNTDIMQKQGTRAILAVWVTEETQQKNDGGN